MIASWKLRREFTRLGQQIRGGVDRFTDPNAQRRLDATVAAGLPKTDGTQPVGDKIALFMIYQPNGLSASTLETCQVLENAGYAPFVVSNCPLSQTDQDCLNAVVWRTVERPNFGYDFGGYRDGLTCLKQWGIEPQEMLILNDSVWLPTMPEADLLARLAAQTADIAGANLRIRGSEKFLESYLYRIRRTALQHPAFHKFWEELRLTSNKYHVIRRGERGFSAAMRAAGLEVAGVYDNKALTGLIADQDDDFLRATLRYGAYIDVDLATEAEHLADQSGPNWRATVLCHITTALLKRQAYSTFPYANMALTGYPLLKKSADPVNKAWRAAYLKVLNAGALPPPSAAILEEINARIDT